MAGRDEEMRWGKREDFKEISEIPFTMEGFLDSIETRRALRQIGIEMEEEGGGWRRCTA